MELPAKNIRPKSVELVALLQSGELDYIYEYRSVAEQNKLNFLVFPPDIDLSDPAKADFVIETERSRCARPGYSLIDEVRRADRAFAWTWKSRSFHGW